MVRAVPGRKTDMADAQWLATLARAGLLRASFIPPVDLRQLRLVARQRQKLVGMCSAEKNRLHKVLVDAGIRVNVVVSDGVARQALTLAQRFGCRSVDWQARHSITPDLLMNCTPVGMHPNVDESPFDRPRTPVVSKVRLPIVVRPAGVPSSFCTARMASTACSGSERLPK